VLDKTESAAALIWRRKTPSQLVNPPHQLDCHNGIAESKFAWKNLKKQTSAEIM
jgi:hypothetical protein